MTTHGLQIQCGTQETQIFNNLSGKVINDLEIPLPPSSLPSQFPIPVWLQAVDSSTKISFGAVYVNEIDITYNYYILLTYKLTSIPGCQSNPISNCQCIQLIKKDKSGNLAPDNILPPGVITNAISILPIVSGGYGTVCTNCDLSSNYCILGTCVPKSYVLYGGAIFAGLSILRLLK